MAYDSTIDGKAVDRSYSAVANLLNKVPFVRSFKITKAADDKHALTINQNRLIGEYPTRDAALGSLMGCVKAGGGAEDFAIASIEDMIAKGRGLFVSANASQGFTMTILNGAITGSGFTNITGDDILSMTAWGKSWNPGQVDGFRLWYGSYTGNIPSGRANTGLQTYPFLPSGGSSGEELGGDYMRRFTTKVSINGGSDITLAKPSGNTQATYQNSTTAVGSNIWAALGSYTCNFTITED
jgi:hypothetical protein